MCTKSETSYSRFVQQFQKLHTAVLNARQLLQRFQELSYFFHIFYTGAPF